MNKPSAAATQRRLRLLAALAGLLLVFLALPAYLAAPVSSALFRLHASTQLMHLRCETANVFHIRASSWELTGAHEDGSPAGTQTITSRSQDPSAALTSDLISIYLEPKDQIELRQLAAGKARYVFTLPARSVQVSVQLREKSVLVRKDAQGGESIDAEAGSDRKSVV